jgi:hypothetical protein
VAAYLRGDAENAPASDKLLERLTVEECQMQVVAVKPIARWQIWLGKWIGILAIDAALLALSGAAIYGLLQWRASRLPEKQQAYLRKDIFVARAEARRPPEDLSPQVDLVFNKISKKFGALTEYQVAEVKQQIRGEITAERTEVPQGFRRRWAVDLHTLADRVRDQPLVLRVKFHTAKINPDAEYQLYWVVGPTNSPEQVTIAEKLPPDSFQEFEVPPNLLDKAGILWVDVLNPPDNNSAISFPLEDGFELLYPESTFLINFMRGLGVIFCWLVLLSAIGLATASYLSFPVAAFASLALLLMGLSSGTVGSVVEQGTIMGYDSAKSSYGHSPVDIVIVPIFRGALKIIKLVESFSPIDSLSSGRSITWGQLGLAVAQIVLLLGGFFCALGIIFFTKRELATAQGNN